MSDTFYKVRNVIWSCETVEHFEVAQRMLDLFNNISNDQSESQYLQKWLNKRIKFKKLA
jgi:hypothetical protein